MTVFFRFNEFPDRSSLFNHGDYLGLTLLNTLHLVIISGLVIGIKITKKWYIQQIENIELKKKNIINDVELQKGEIYPAFINKYLNTLSKKIALGEEDAAARLLILSEIISFVLYESSDEWIRLNQELNAVSKLIEIEKEDGNNKLDVHLTTHGEVENFFVKPLIVFSFLQHFLSHEKINQQQFLIDINIIRDNLTLTVRIYFPMAKSDHFIYWKETVAVVKNKMNILYNNCCKIEILINDYIVSVVLNTLLKADGSSTHVSAALHS